MHAISLVFDEEETNGIILIDRTNAFNQMNRPVAMHNLPITWNKMSLHIIRSPFRLFICGGGDFGECHTRRSSTRRSSRHALMFKFIYQTSRKVNQMPNKTENYSSINNHNANIERTETKSFKNLVFDIL